MQSHEDYTTLTLVETLSWTKLIDFNQFQQVPDLFRNLDTCFTCQNTWVGESHNGPLFIIHRSLYFLLCFPPWCVVRQYLKHLLCISNPLRSANQCCFRTLGLHWRTLKQIWTARKNFETDHLIKNILVVFIQISHSRSPRASCLGIALNGRLLTAVKVHDTYLWVAGIPMIFNRSLFLKLAFNPFSSCHWVYIYPGFHGQSGEAYQGRGFWGTDTACLLVKHWWATKLSPHLKDLQSYHLIKYIHKFK